MVYNKHGPRHQGRKGQYVNNHWFDDIEVIPEEARIMPFTVSHEEIGPHEYGCRCVPCSQYPTEIIRKARSAARRRPPAHRQEPPNPPAA